jgi:hypothetical protein
MLKEMSSAFIGDSLTSLKVIKVCVVTCSGHSNLGVNIIHKLCYAFENVLVQRNKTKQKTQWLYSASELLRSSGSGTGSTQPREYN